MQLNNYQRSIYLIGLALFIFTFLFKYYTGTFLTISKESGKEMISFEINKRKNDISIKSLKASCLNYQDVFNGILLDFKRNDLPCNQLLYNEILTSSMDSAYYKFIEKMYEHANFYEKEITDTGRILYLYQNKNEDCVEPAIITFVDTEEESLIESIQNLPNYLECYCVLSKKK